ncbi:MAG: ferritin family protein [Wenzhouxiangellaceae bacterium]|nr:ferritin family protein [Wenzhouxiangellaceae bacterium]
MHDSLEQFLRCAARLEADAAEGYDTLAATIGRERYPEVHALFERFAGFSRMHLHEVLEIQRRELGRGFDVGGESFDWPDGLSPENPLAVVELEGITPERALEHALEVERRACDFYAHVAGRTRSPRVQQLAHEFAEEESAHVDHLERWLGR